MGITDTGFGLKGLGRAHTDRTLHVMFWQVLQGLVYERARVFIGDIDSVNHPRLSRRARQKWGLQENPRKRCSWSQRAATVLPRVGHVQVIRSFGLLLGALPRSTPFPLVKESPGPSLGAHSRLLVSGLDGACPQVHRIALPHGAGALVAGQNVPHKRRHGGTACAAAGVTGRHVALTDPLVPLAVQRAHGAPSIQPLHRRQQCGQVVVRNALGAWGNCPLGHPFVFWPWRADILQSSS